MTAPTPPAPGAPGGPTAPATPPGTGGPGSAPATPAPTPPSTPPTPPAQVEPGAPSTAADGTRSAGRMNEGIAVVDDPVTAAARAAVAPPETPAAGAPGAGTEWKVTDLPEGAQKLITDLRTEAAQRRTEAKGAESKAKELEGQLTGFLDGFAKVLGLTEETTANEPPDPARLSEALEAAQRERREALALVAVYDAATEHGGNPKALTDSVSFRARINRLDPAAEDFAAQVSTAVAEAVQSNPLFKAAGQAPAAPITPSGGEFAGRPSGPRDPESLSVDDFRKDLASRRS